MHSAIIFGLGVLKRLKLLLMPSGRRHRVEANHWGRVDLDRARQVSWDSIECLGRMAVSEMTGGRWEQLMDVIIDAIAPSDPNHLRGLMLGCGDMACEHWFFVHSALPFPSIAANSTEAYAIESGLNPCSSSRLTKPFALTVSYPL